MVERHIITIWIIALSTGSFMSQNILNIGVWPWGPCIALTRKSSHIVLSQIGLSPCSGEPCGSLPDPSKNQSFLHHHHFLFWLGNALHTLFPFTFPYFPVHGTPPYLLQLVSIVCLKDVSAGWPWPFAGALLSEWGPDFTEDGLHSCSFNSCSLCTLSPGFQGIYIEGERESASRP